MHIRKLKIAPLLKKDLKKIDVLVRADAKNKTNILLMNPISTELNIKKLKGFQNKYRVVIIKNHRMIYTFNKEELILVRIKHRKDLYKKKLRKKKSNIKQYYKDNALILILEFSIPFVLSLIFYYFSGEYKIDLLMSLVFWSVTLIPHHLNNILGSFSVWKGKFEVDEEILFTYSVYIKSMTIFKYNLIITNKNLILKSIYGENKYNIIFPLEKILRIEIEKNKLVLKFKFYTEIKLRADNPELIKEEFDKIKSEINKDKLEKEIA